MPFINEVWKYGIPYLDTDNGHNYVSLGRKSLVNVGREVLICRRIDFVDPFIIVGVAVC